jgi:CheY-like chemotaxis protein
LDNSPPLVLVVEDEPLIRIDISAALEDGGYRTEAAGDGAEALAKFGELSPALLVTDIYMHGKDGLELIGDLRRTGADTPIIAMSGHPERYDVLAIARKLGANATIEKPFSHDDLLRLVGDILRT